MLLITGYKNYILLESEGLRKTRKKMSSVPSNVLLRGDHSRIINELAGKIIIIDLPGKVFIELAGFSILIDLAGNIHNEMKGDNNMWTKY